MKQFWRPLVAAAVACIALVVMVLVNKSAEHYSKGRSNNDLPASYILGWLAALVVLIIAVVTAVKYGRRSWSGFQRSRGRLTPVEIQAQQVQAAAAAAWQDSRRLAADLRDGRTPPTLTIWGIVPYGGEEVYLDVQAHYGRFYGGDGTYRHVNGFFWGSAGFMLTGYAVTALGNRRAREQARREAMTCWRDIQPTRVIATNRRLICHVFGSWMSFDYETVAEFYPEPAAYRMVLAFPNTSPLMISGPYTPLLAVLATRYIYGVQALDEHPAMAALGR